VNESHFPTASSIADARRLKQSSVFASHLPWVLLMIYMVIWSALAIAPISRSDWLLENLLVIAALPFLIATSSRMRFSNVAYLCLFVFFVLHAIGAHYTYSLVPYDRWLEAITGTSWNELLGWQRNHYDRLVHFLYGALMLLPGVELLDRYARPTSIWRWLLPVLFITSHSVIFELVEWIAVMIVAPDLGEAYLGTQGDGWDAQKDMALATLGSVIGMLLFAASHAIRTRRILLGR
jgi:putative membrane protein